MEDAELKGAKHVSRVLKTRSRFTALLTVYFFIALIIPNLVLANTEPYSLWTVEALILMPLGFYMMWSVALRRSGVMIWLGFPFIFFCAFQIVLLYLFGNSIIATDMFTNLLTTNPGEAGELLGNIYPAVVLVCVIYLPLLWLAAREIALKRYITYTTRMNIGLTGAVLFSLGILALLPAYRVSEDKHVLRDEIFPLNVLYNLYLSGSEFRKSYNYPETSADFTYGARRTAELPDREVYVYIIGEAARAMNWQLYGYARETNPRLSEVDGLVVFRDMLTLNQDFFRQDKRVPPLPIGLFVFRPVSGRIPGEMRLPTIGQEFNERRPLSAPGPLHSLFHSLHYSLNVISIHAAVGHSISLRPCMHLFPRMYSLIVCGNSVLVVNKAVDDGQLPGRCHRHTLMHRPLTHHAVSNEHKGNSRIVLALCIIRCPKSGYDSGTHDSIVTHISVSPITDVARTA